MRNNIGSPVLFSLKQWICLGLLVCLFVVLNSPSTWEWMYPIAYEKEVEEASRQFQVDPYLILAVVQNESGFKHERSSHKGAQGLMQLMPETAYWAAEQIGLDEGDVHIDSPRWNILIGSWYLAYLLEKYEGNMVKAAGAYNAGEGNMDRWLEQGVWDGSEQNIEDIPYGETRHYLTRVLFYYDQYQKIYTHTF